MKRDQSPFGVAFATTVPHEKSDVSYDAARQTCEASDAELASLVASDNTLTFTAGKDNDFDE